jgi:hypothetical protein
LKGLTVICRRVALKTDFKALPLGTINKDGLHGKALSYTWFCGSNIEGVLVPEKKET